jgi:hypothetical protein
MFRKTISSLSTIYEPPILGPEYMRQERMCSITLRPVCKIRVGRLTALANQTRG